MDGWWRDPSVWAAFGRSKQYQMRSTAYLGGWSGHPKKHGKNNILVFRKEGITYRSFRDLFVIPWDAVTTVEVEGPDSPPSRTTARLEPLGVFPVAGKKRSRSVAVVAELSSGEAAIFHSEQVSVEEVRTKLLPITNRLSRAATSASSPAEPSPPAEPSAPADPVADELMKLAQLRDQGTITDEQFEAQRAKLLG